MNRPAFEANRIYFTSSIADAVAQNQCCKNIFLFSINCFFEIELISTQYPEQVWPKMLKKFFVYDDDFTSVLCYYYEIHSGTWPKLLKNQKISIVGLFQSRNNTLAERIFMVYKINLRI